MKSNVIILEELCVYGLSIKLTKSQAKNYSIIRNNWMRFNVFLKNNNIILDKTNWSKYGVTYKISDNYFYMSTIPSLYNIPKLEKFVINHNDYLVITHLGDMSSLKTSIDIIYKKYIPENNILLDRKESLIHFEKYDKRFLWNSTNSKIDLYLPLENK